MNLSHTDMKSWQANTPLKDVALASDAGDVALQLECLETGGDTAACHITADALLLNVILKYAPREDAEAIVANFTKLNRYYE